jgi:hypothetical protein
MELASQLAVFEVDRPLPQAWKRQRLVELGLGVPAWLHLVPVDFETGQGWWEALLEAGFKAVELVSATQLTARYLADRSAGLRATSFQELLIAET